MNPLDVDWEPRRITREELEASFKPCPICGRKEKMTTEGVYKISHDMAAHGLLTTKPAPRLSTEQLIGIPSYDFRDFSVERREQ